MIVLNLCLSVTIFNFCVVLRWKTEFILNYFLNFSPEFESYGCDADRKLPDQPDIVGFPVIKKCCRDNENLRIANTTVESFSCHRHDYPIYVNYSIVELYEDCIWFRNRSGGEIELQSVEKPPNHEYFP